MFLRFINFKSGKLANACGLIDLIRLLLRLISIRFCSPLNHFGSTLSKLLSFSKIVCNCCNLIISLKNSFIKLLLKSLNETSSSLKSEPKGTNASCSIIFRLLSRIISLFIWLMPWNDLVSILTKPLSIKLNELSLNSLKESSGIELKLLFFIVKSSIKL